jgi:predicted RNA-binding protein with PUA-like domain
MSDRSGETTAARSQKNRSRRFANNWPIILPHSPHPNWSRSRPRQIFPAASKALRLPSPANKVSLALRRKAPPPKVSLALRQEIRLALSHPPSLDSFPDRKGCGGISYAEYFVLGILRPRPFYQQLQMKNYWLVKSEPESYSWDSLVKERKTSWTGVRNFTARNNLRAMRVGDEVLYYHSVTDKAVVGIATVVRAAYPDATAKQGDWSTVDLAPVKALRNPVTLEQIKGKPSLKNISLVRQSRLSVHKLAALEFREILRLSRER